MGEGLRRSDLFASILLCLAKSNALVYCLTIPKSEMIQESDFAMRRVKEASTTSLPR